MIRPAGSHAGTRAMAGSVSSAPISKTARRWRFPAFTVNWNYITGLVAHAGLQARDTALNEVSEVQAGERLRLFFAACSNGRCSGIRSTSPETAPLESADEAVALLRTTTEGCVHTWASCYSGILHNLSGGLDSSIVLSCLKSAPSRPRVTCLNYFTTGPNEDERHYARLMAERSDIELVECKLEPLRYNSRTS